jgi:alcohol dehydrogenase
MKRAYELLKEWKGDSYVHGLGVLDQVGPLAAAFGKRALVVSNNPYMKPVADRVVSYLQGSVVELAAMSSPPMPSPMPP